MRLPHLVVALCSAAFVEGVTFALTCSNYPGPCNNKCYSTFVAGKPSTFVWNGPTQAQKDANRRAAGTIPNPCCANTITAPPLCSLPDGGAAACTSPDEYPYASSNLGGQATGSAIVRCTGEAENLLEGSDLGGTIRRSVTDGKHSRLIKF